MFKSSQCDYGDVYIVLKGMITVARKVVDAASKATN